MENTDIDLSSNPIANEEQLFHNTVICDDAELFYIDCYLRELFRQDNEAWTKWFESYSCEAGLLRFKVSLLNEGCQPQRLAARVLGGGYS